MLRSPTRRGFTQVELLVVLGILAMVLTVMLVLIVRQRETNARLLCAKQLRSIGQAILLYSNDNRGAYPRVRASTQPVRVPVWGTGVAATQPFADDGPAENDVTAALFLLLRTQDITSEIFICPSSRGKRDNFGGGGSPLTQSSFTNSNNLTYSYHNPYLSDAARIPSRFMSTIGAEFAVAADMNPGTAGGDNVLTPTKTSPATAMRVANSNNHDKDGQNVLYGDGHVAWEDNPFVGMNKDNIYTTADGKIAASGVDLNDSILLPTDD